MNKIIKLFTIPLLLNITVTLTAQITIGSTNTPDTAKLLQVESDGGIGLPRVQLVSTTTLQPFIDPGDLTPVLKEEHTGLVVYNLTTTDGFRQGVYVWNGNVWVKAGEAATSVGKRWFYMPAFNLPMGELGNKTYDLYAEYKKQFTQSLNSKYRVSSASVTTVPSPEIGTLYEKGELDYAVVYYDNTVITVTGITAEGVMSYNVLDVDPGPLSFMTVIFVVK